MKKIINDPSTVVDEALDGAAAAHADLLTLHRNPTFVTRADGPIAGKVALVSGGGSGHEPLHVGYVGAGMLDAAPPRRSTGAPGSCTSSRTTPVTC